MTNDKSFNKNSKYMLRDEAKEVCGEMWERKAESFLEAMKLARSLRENPATPISEAQKAIMKRYPIWYAGKKDD